MAQERGHWGTGARLMGLAVAGLVVLTSCRDGGPERSDVRPEAYLVYPGAVEVSRNWRAEEHGTSVDGSDMSHTARMTIRFQLPEPVPNATIWRWYEEQLREKGWVRQPEGATNHSIFVQQVGERRHLLSVEAGGDVSNPVSTFRVHYNIDVARK